MPVLTNLNPVTAYTASVVTDGTILTNGLGSQLTSVQITSSFSQTASYSVTSSLSVISQFDISSSFASSSVTSSTLITNSVIPNISCSGVLDFYGPSGDMLVYNQAAGLVISSSNGGYAFLGGGLIYSTLGFQVGGGVGYNDNRQSPGVAVWNAGTFALSSSNVLLSEVNTLHNISSSTLLQTQIDAKASLVTASASPSNPSSPVGWANVTILGIKYWLPLYQ